METSETAKPQTVIISQESFKESAKELGFVYRYRTTFGKDIVNAAIANIVNMLIAVLKQESPNISPGDLEIHKSILTTKISSRFQIKKMRSDSLRQWVLYENLKKNVLRENNSEEFKSKERLEILTKYI